MGFTSYISAKFQLCIEENKPLITIILMTFISHHEWENAWYKMGGWVVTVVLTLSYDRAISGVCTHAYACMHVHAQILWTQETIE